MANNWKITDGANYIAKASNGAAAGAAGTMEAPRTISSTAFVPGKNVIGTGVYLWPAGYAMPAYTNLYADGRVIILGNGTANQPFLTGQNIVNGLFLDQWLGINAGFNVTSTWQNCIVRLNSFSSSNMTQNVGIAPTNCVFINVSCTTAGSGSVVTNCLLFNSYIVNTSSASSPAANNYLDINSSLTAGAAINCNVDPALIVGTTKGIKIGAAAFGDGSQSGCTGCLRVAPLFNNPSKDDWTLQLLSAHITAGIGPSQYGGAVSFTIASTAGSGNSMTAANTGFASIGATTVPILTISGDGILANNAGGAVINPTSGGTYVSTILSGVLVLDAINIREMGGLLPIAGFNIDSDYQATDPFAPVTQNNNVPDYGASVSGSADRKPNRMTCRIRWSSILNPDPAVPGHWVSGAAFVEMEYFAKASYNLSGYVGNGAVGFIAANALPVFCRTYQLELTIRNNYA